MVAHGSVLMAQGRNVDRRERLRRLLTSSATMVAAVSVSVAASAVSELVSSVSTRQSWLGTIAVAVVIITFLMYVGALLLRMRRGRARQTDARAGVVADPQLRDLLHELEIEQERFDRAMLDRQR